MKHKYLQCIGIALSLLGSAIICFRTALEEVLLNMGIGDWITIGGIIIGFLGVILGVTIPLRRDGKTIDSISADTTDIKPKVDTISSTVNTISPSIVKIEERNSKIDAIMTEIEVFKRLKSEAGGSIVKPEVLLVSISSVLEENADLRKQHQEDQQKILTQNAEIYRLRLRNQQLEAILKPQSPAPSEEEEWAP